MKTINITISIYGNHHTTHERSIANSGEFLKYTWGHKKQSLFVFCTE